jgi:ribosomal protein S18 acetylase RimI-like enzyme
VTGGPGFAALRDHLARSWPAAEAVAAPGWLLRATPAVPRGRLNSALPLETDPDLAVVEEFYAERGLPPQVQMTPRGGHPRLAAELDARGWGSRWTALVMSAPAGPPAAAGDVALLDAPSPAWLEEWGAAEGRSAGDVAAHAEVVLSRVVGRAAFALCDGAVGIAVAEGSLCALFCVAVRPEFRRRGLASRVVGALANFGVERGATWLCLEVEERNVAGVRLYERLGFTREYAYVHRGAL